MSTKRLTLAGSAVLLVSAMGLPVAQKLSPSEKNERSRAVAASQPATRLASQPATDAGVLRGEHLILDLGESVTMKLAKIQAGRFLMGSSRDEPGRDYDEGLPPGEWVNGEPRVAVTLSRPFYIGIHEVTVKQYARFVECTGYRASVIADAVAPLDSGQQPLWRTPGFRQTADHPVVNVSWLDAVAFCEWLSAHTGRSLRLPTEAEWEYACRAGSQSRYSFGDASAELHKHGNYCDQANTNNNEWQDRTHRDGHDRTAPVGSFQPNRWGLYDMHGNVAEWCADQYWHGYTAEAAEAHVDPKGPDLGGFPVRVVIRGGSYNADAVSCRSATRSPMDFHVPADATGFRVVVVLGDGN